jgi:hypothetical protein
MAAHKTMANHIKEQVVHETITQPQYYPVKKRDLHITGYQ